MKIIAFLFFLLIASFSQRTFGQNQLNHTDSVIFYLNESKSGNAIDSINFFYAIRLMEGMQTDEKSVSRIQNVILDFKKLKDKKYYYLLEYNLIFRLQLTQQFYKQIDLGKQVIAYYENAGDTAYKKYFCDILHSLRVPFRSTDRLSEGFDYYGDKLKMYYPKNDKEVIAICYFIYGGFYLTQGLGDRSAYYFKKCISYLNPGDTNSLSRTGLKVWADRVGNLASLYNSMENYKEAAHYARIVNEAPLVDINSNDSMNRSLVLRYFAEAKMMLHQNDSVLVPLSKAIQLAFLTKSAANIAGCYEVKGRYFLLLNRIDSAENYLVKAKKYIQENGLSSQTPWGIFTPNYYLAKIRVTQKRYKDAENLVLSEIPLLLNVNRELLKEKKLLVSIYMLMGDISSAHDTYMEYISMQDELNKNEQKNRIMSFENEQLLENLTNEKVNNEIAISRHKTQKLIYLAGAVLLVFLSFFIFLNFRNQKEINKLMKDAHTREKTKLEFQKQQTILNERLRISRNLHDEVGATLSGLSMYSYLAKEQVQSGKHGQALQSLSVMQRAATLMVEKLHDIVWLVNPAHDSLENVLQKLEEYAFETASAKQIIIESNLHGFDKATNFSMGMLGNIFLICKEAINNAVKYSQANLIALTISVINEELIFSIEDNGIGFEHENVKKGNGLLNMQKRAEEIGALFSIATTENAGTKITFSCKFVS